VVLSVAAVVAALGGVFTPSGPSRAAASTMASTQHKVAKFPLPPSASGSGRRIVFDQSDQRVWLVAANGEVERSYLVTGSKDGNLRPGSYQVRGRVRYARAAIGRGTLEYFVRFAQGHHAAIGFHAITVNRYGRLAHSRAELGTPTTPGCVEEWRDDAEALWAFAPLGTPVVVTT
jgi:hypothetical protein